MSTWSVKTRRDPSRHRKDARINVPNIEDRCFRLPPIEAMFSSIGWFIAVLVVVAELESNI